MLLVGWERGIRTPVDGVRIDFIVICQDAGKAFINRVFPVLYYGKPSNFILKYHVMPEKLRLKIDLDKGGQCPLFYYRQQVGPEVDLFVIQSELIS